MLILPSSVIILWKFLPLTLPSLHDTQMQHWINNVYAYVSLPYVCIICIICRYSRHSAFLMRFSSHFYTHTVCVSFCIWCTSARGRHFHCFSIGYGTENLGLHMLPAWWLSMAIDSERKRVSTLSEKFKRLPRNFFMTKGTCATMRWRSIREEKCSSTVSVEIRGKYQPPSRQ